MLFLSTSLLAGEVSMIPGNMRDSVYLTHPHSLPEDYDTKSMVLKLWLKSRDLTVTNKDIQSKMYFLGWKLPDAIKVSDGSRVIVTILGPNTKIEDEFLSEELENEDVEFVRACRGRLAKQLQKDH